VWYQRVNNDLGASRFFFYFPVPVCAIRASGVPGCTLVSMNRFSTLCGWLVQRQGWRRKGECDRVSTSGEVRYGREWGEILSIRPCGSSRVLLLVHAVKILRHGTFPLYFPSERKVCYGFLSPLKIHRLGRVLNPQHLDPVTSTLTTTTPRRQFDDTYRNWLSAFGSLINNHGGHYFISGITFKAQW
jgi:hypothetical protein